MFVPHDQAANEQMRSQCGISGHFAPCFRWFYYVRRHREGIPKVRRLSARCSWRVLHPRGLHQYFCENDTLSVNSDALSWPSTGGGAFVELLASTQARELYGVLAHGNVLICGVCAADCLQPVVEKSTKANVDSNRISSRPLDVPRSTIDCCL